MRSRLFVALSVMALVALSAAFDAKDCSEVPDCVNEYQWKHQATADQANTFCQNRYPTCKNINSARDMKTYCKIAASNCRSFILGYGGYTEEASAKSRTWCQSRLPRCRSSGRRRIRSDVFNPTMATVGQATDPQLEEFSGLSLNGESSGPEIDGNDRNEAIELYENWGLPLSDLYRLAMQFYREKEGKAVNFSYQDKLKLVAFTQQVIKGKFNEEKLPPLGVLDMPGRDRRLAWQALGEMSQEMAMKSFVDMLDSLCPLFKPFIEAHKRDAEERIRLAQEQEEKEKQLQEEKRIQAEQERLKEEEASQQEAQRRKIQEALNQQTFTQFKSYAEQQFPGNPEQQAVLIRQLQEQHYHQYMQQLLHQQLGGPATNEKGEQCLVPNLANENITYYTNGSRSLPMATSTGTIITNGNIEDGDADGDEEQSLDFPEISSASMWTHKDLKEFKESIRKEASEAVIKVGHGETVTLRVPTHEKGSSLYWEFATDNYDIGFGVYFEWTKPTTSAVTLHVSESEDEDDDDDDDEEEIVYPEGSDVEAGTEKIHKPSSLHRPLVSVIVPVYRRDCQEEVYAGIHQYPGEGVYLLKFDNSYSLWRSKTLYYRVYYHP